MSTPNPPDPKAKAGASKPDVSLIPPVSILHMAMAMEEGASNKPNPYGPFNWRDKDVEARTYLAAALRHVLDLLDGFDYTADASGAPVHNAGGAMASLGIFLDAQENGRLIDNRPLQGTSETVSLRMKAQKQAAAPRVAEGKRAFAAEQAESTKPFPQVLYCPEAPSGFITAIERAEPAPTETQDPGPASGRARHHRVRPRKAAKRTPKKAPRSSRSTR